MSDHKNNNSHPVHGFVSGCCFVGMLWLGASDLEGWLQTAGMVVLFIAATPSTLYWINDGVSNH